MSGDEAAITLAVIGGFGGLVGGMTLSMADEPPPWAWRMYVGAVLLLVGPAIIRLYAAAVLS